MQYYIFLMWTQKVVSQKPCSTLLMRRKIMQRISQIKHVWHHHKISNISLMYNNISWPQSIIPDMETRDGTPFMGLTTQDQGTTKPSTKRCNNCHKTDSCTCKDVFVQKCKDCLHFAASPERHREHRREARHIHSYRNRAYRLAFNLFCFEFLWLQRKADQKFTVSVEVNGLKNGFGTKISWCWCWAKTLGPRKGHLFSHAATGINKRPPISYQRLRQIAQEGFFQYINVSV